MSTPNPPPPVAPRSAPFGDQARLRVALVHDWLLGMRGGEWVLESILKLFPAASIYTLFYNPAGVCQFINLREIHPSLLNRLPLVRRYYRNLLPLMPPAIEALRIEPDIQFVLSVSHCVAHGIRVPEGAVHAAYYLSPMRYLYDHQATYEKIVGMSGRILRWMAPRLRRWDHRAAHRPRHVWAISRYVAQRIDRAYGRQARVIFPPVRTDLFRPALAVPRVDEYLLVSALVPYKRIDLAIRAANRLHKRLRIVGGGPMLESLRRLAGPTVTLEGRVSQARLVELCQTRRALIFTAREDFGLAPLEAMACGTPVLGLRGGGLLESLVDGVCGTFFDQPEADSLAEAWAAFDPDAYDPAALREHALKFGEERFHAELAAAVREALTAG